MTSEAEARGIALGAARGKVLGEEKNLVQNLKVSLDKAMDILNVSNDQRDKYRRLIES